MNETELTEQRGVRKVRKECALRMLELQEEEPKFTIEFISKITELSIFEVQMLNEIRIKNLKK